jgi:sulfur transfer protein SufE
MTIKQDLKALQKEFKELGEKMDKYKQAIEKGEKTPAKKVATKKAKTVKAKPKFTAAKKPARKKPAKKTSK